MNMFSEQDLLRLIARLVDLFARLQRVKIAHRNIKPANLVISSTGGGQRSKSLNFEDMIVCNFENSICFPVNATAKEMVCSQDEKCSAIYASPLVQKKVNFLADKIDSDVVIEVAENQEESFDQSSMDMSERTPIKKSFSHEEMESNRLQWAAAKFNPFIEDVFSLGLTILQVVY